MPLPRLVGHGNRPVDDEERPMPRRPAAIGPDLLSELIAVGMSGIDDDLSAPRPIFDNLEIADGDPDGMHVRLRAEQVADPLELLEFKISVPVRVVVVV